MRALGGLVTPEANCMLSLCRYLHALHSVKFTRSTEHAAHERAVEAARVRRAALAWRMRLALRRLGLHSNAQGAWGRGMRDAPQRAQWRALGAATPNPCCLMHALVCYEAAERNAAARRAVPQR